METRDNKDDMTSRKPDRGCLLPFLACLYPSSEVQRSKQIDEAIKKQKHDFVSTHRLLLLGAGESGKSTIIKQMQLIHVNKFTETLRWQRRDDIRSNLVEAIISILRAMSNITPPVNFHDAENERLAEWVLEHADQPNFGYPKFYDYIEILWRDKGVQATYERSNEYQLIDNAKYFLDKVYEIGKIDYVPTDQDILRCRVLTTGIYELTFQVKDVKFQIIDVGGQRDERRKWFLCFNDVTAIIFVTSCSSYDMVLREDSSKNRLLESLELFKIVWNNRWLCHISVILFMNKQDLFKEKILSGRSKLEQYYPAFKDFKCTEREPGEDPEVTRAKQFIKEQFEKISKVSNHSLEHCFFPHFTTAVDTENMKRVFEDCRHNIQVKNLVDYDLI